MQRALTAQIEVLEPIRACGCGGTVNPGIALACVLFEVTAHHQSRSRHQSGIQANALSVLFPINVEAEIVEFPARRPAQDDTLGARLRGERLQMNPRRSC